MADGEDVSDHEAAGRLVRRAIETYGRLDAVVNNAGILRDRMLVNMTVEEWDAVMAVHLRGTFSVTRHAAGYWREQAKAGERVTGRVVNTTSSSGIYGNVGQTNYGAAKAGIAAFTVIAAMELGRYGVTVNAIAPTALTRMTEGLAGFTDRPAEDLERVAPGHVAPLVAWLAGPSSGDITGRVFNVSGREISVAEGWVAGPAEHCDTDWRSQDLDEIIPRLVAAARPNSDQSGRPIIA